MPPGSHIEDILALYRAEPKAITLLSPEQGRKYMALTEHFPVQQPLKGRGQVNTFYLSIVGKHF